MDENNKFDVVGTNIAEKATMIWNVADMLRGPFKPHEYGLVILPMTVVKRFHDCLLPTHKAVLEQYEKVKNFAVIDGFLTKASGYQFYNISKYTFESLLADPENIEANFRDYLNGFSANVQDVLAKFDFDNIIRRTGKNELLAPRIENQNNQFTKAILFAKVPFELTTKEDRMRTCYMQACLAYVNFEGISNSDIRKIFGLGEKEKAKASRLLTSAVDGGYIKVMDPDTAPRYKKYIPYWA